MAKTEFMKIRVQPDEKLAFEQAAELAWAPLSAWMRERLRREAAERESAQSSLGAHHSLLQAVVDASPTLIFIKDRDGIWILANQT